MLITAILSPSVVKATCAVLYSRQDSRRKISLAQSVLRASESERSSAEADTRNSCGDRSKSPAPVMLGTTVGEDGGLRFRTPCAVLTRPDLNRDQLRFRIVR
jgi:hypothetical protein